MSSETITDVQYGAIIYTDGSAIDNPGPVGYGAHGYKFILATDQAKPNESDKHFITDHGYVDVNADPDYKHVEAVTYYDFVGADPSRGTNNKAELLAAIKMLDHLKDENLVSVTFYCDSEYVINGATKWHKSWVRNNWVKMDGTDVPNTNLWKELLRLIKLYEDKKIQLTFNWVKGHNDHKGNEEADQLSRVGSKYARSGLSHNQVVEISAKDLKKYETDKHPLFCHKNLYFNSNKDYNTAGEYYMSDPGVGDFMVGKRNPEAGFSIIRLKTPCEAIETLRTAQCDTPIPYTNIFMSKLDTIFSKRIHRMSAAFKDKYFMLQRRNNGELETACKQLLTIRMTPTGLSLRAIEAFKCLDDILDSFLRFRIEGFDHKDNVLQLRAHDITDSFYSYSEKKVKGETVSSCELLKSHAQGLNNTTVVVYEPIEDSMLEVKLPLIYGCDIPHRNNLKRLEAVLPRVYAITWREVSNTLRYTVVFETSDGVGLYSNFFSDKIFLKVQG